MTESTSGTMSRVAAGHRVEEFGCECRRFLAFYLPQFHPTPENDEWWGTGFTDWRNVARARPTFRGHYQPHVPADLGFYDLRRAEAREAQATLATAHGIDGFVYYHYWFGGRRLLAEPLDRMLETQEPNFPFALCWANESWTRAWDGENGACLIEQRYSPEDDLAHIRWLAEIFADPRYIRVEGKPLLLVYKADNLPDQRRTSARWRAEIDRIGFRGLYLCRIEAHGVQHTDPIPLGFDAAVAFQPNFADMPPRVRGTAVARLVRRTVNPRSGLRIHNVHEFRELARRASQDTAGYVRYPCVCPGWDNSPRRTRWAHIFRGATPGLYETWLRDASYARRSSEHEANLVFVNAWNEWAEGAHLEPDLRWGRAFLEAHSRVAALHRAGRDCRTE